MIFHDTLAIVSLTYHYHNKWKQVAIDIWTKIDFFIFRIEITDLLETVLLSVLLVPVLLCQLCKHKTEWVIEVNVLMLKYWNQTSEVKVLEWKHWSWSIKAKLLKWRYGSENIDIKILKLKHISENIKVNVSRLKDVLILNNWN